MIDLIIPYYNNRVGLLNTIKSVNTDIFKITIIDDHSTETPIIDNSVAQVFRVNINGGPGQARQKGINKTDNPYIMFLDTGDIFLSYEIQNEIIEAIKQYPNADVIMWSYYHGTTPTTFLDNRMHGKLYKREFLEKNNITFCPNSSYMNEDIGFNHACRLLTKNEIPFINKQIIRQILVADSLTQKDDHLTLYRDQTKSLSLVSIHTIENCKKQNIDVSIEINQIAIALYYWFIRTAAERPIFLQDAWTGARIFYNKYIFEIIPTNLTIGNAKLKQCLEYRNKINFPINILRFAHEIQQNEIIPNNYLT